MFLLSKNIYICIYLKHLLNKFKRIKFYIFSVTHTLKGKATFLKFFWFLVRIEILCKLWIVLFKFFKKLFSFSRYEALKYSQITLKKTTHLSFLKVTTWQIVWRQKVLENVRRQLHVGKTVIDKQTNRQYVSSIINYKNTFKVIIFSKHCFSNFPSSNFGDFTAVFVYIYIVVMSSCATYIYIVVMSSCAT